MGLTQTPRRNDVVKVPVAVAPGVPALKINSAPPVLLDPTFPQIGFSRSLDCLSVGGARRWRYTRMREVHLPNVGPTAAR